MSQSAGTPSPSPERAPSWWANYLRSIDHEEAVSAAYGIPFDWIDRLPPSADATRLAIAVRELRRYPERKDLRIERCLRDAADTIGPALEEVPEPERDAAMPPVWPSTLSALDLQGGGFYGVSVVGGETGVGKSSLAIASSIEAVRAGWKAVYVNAELDRGTLGLYLHRYLQAPPAEIRRTLDSGWALYDLGPSATVRAVANRIADTVTPDTERLVVVLDSINTIAEVTIAQEGAYFDALRRWVLWAMQARRMSEGLVSFLLVSELNRLGQTKGVKADYAADLVLRMKRGDAPGHVRIEATKGRYSGAAGFGAHYFDHHTGTFQRPNGRGA